MAELSFAQVSIVLRSLLHLLRTGSLCLRSFPCISPAFHVCSQSVAFWRWNRAVQPVAIWAENSSHGLQATTGVSVHNQILTGLNTGLNLLQCFSCCLKLIQQHIGKYVPCFLHSLSLLSTNLLGTLGFWGTWTEKQAAAENNTGINISYYCRNPCGLKTLFSCVWQGAPESNKEGESQQS